MKRSYFIVPLIGLLLFGAAYARYAAKYEARLLDQQRLEELAKQEKDHAREAAMEAARQQATEAIKRRQQEREAEEQLEAVRKAERLGAEQLRAATIENERRLGAQVERSRTDVKSLEGALVALEAQRRSLEREKEFLSDYVKQAEENRAEYFRLLEKLEAAGRARTAAAPSITANPSQP
jgi:hypothetical protein